MKFCVGNFVFRSIGITVDVHVHRVVNRLGWVNTKEPNATKKELESFIPEDTWTDIERLYEFGQKVCKAVDPQCDTCPANKLCPSSKAKN